MLVISLNALEGRELFKASPESRLGGSLSHTWM